MVYVRTKMILRQIIISICTLSIALVFHSVVAHSDASRPNGSVHGVLKYRLIDAKTTTVINEGTLNIGTVYTVDRYIPSIMHKYFEDRYIKVYNDFIIGFNNYGYKNKQEVSGFGLWLVRLDQDIFSWEWYTRDRDNTFTKLQGDGQLKVKFRQRGTYWEIASMTFVGDHILRAKDRNIVARLLRLITGGPDKDWYCVVKDGSYIIW